MEKIEYKMRCGAKMKIFVSGLFFMFFGLSGFSDAQVFLGAEVGPDSFMGSGQETKPEKKPAVHPYAGALALYFSSATWASIQVSTSAPEKDITVYLYAGYYRQEIIQLIILAEKTGRPLKELAKEREKGGSLSAMAKKAGLDFNEFFEKSLEIRNKIDTQFLPLVSVSTSAAAVSSETVKSTPHGEKKK